ncbi:hypothetical protein HZA33_00905 [Candidatus Pacearchaeota archaeon]|nr:hypothetical protein [Candidatus Pacearchaeota archaeon]
MPVEVKSAIDWKGAMPVMVLLFVIAVLAMQGILIGEGFVGLAVLSALIILLLPVLNNAGISAKQANIWFVRAAVFLMLAAAFTIVPDLSESITTVAMYITNIAIILAWLMLFIGSLVALANIKA